MNLVVEMFIFFSRYLINVLLIKEYFINDRNFFLMQLAISLIVRIRVFAYKPEFLFCVYRGDKYNQKKAG